MFNMRFAHDTYLKRTRKMSIKTAHAQATVSPYKRPLQNRLISHISGNLTCQTRWHLRSHGNGSFHLPEHLTKQHPLSTDCSGVCRGTLRHVPPPWRRRRPPTADGALDGECSFQLLCPKGRPTFFFHRR